MSATLVVAIMLGVTIAAAIVVGYTTALRRLADYLDGAGYGLRG